MDEEFRDEVIPKATQRVEEFYECLKQIDSVAVKVDGRSKMMSVVNR